MGRYLKFGIVASMAAALVACSAANDEQSQPDPSEAAQADTDVNASAEASFEVCDESGNRYPSEEAARQAGLEEAQYGATYCQYFEPQ